MVTMDEVKHTESRAFSAPFSLTTPVEIKQVVAKIKKNKKEIKIKRFKGIESEKN